MTSPPNLLLQSPKHLTMVGQNQLGQEIGSLGTGMVLLGISSGTCLLTVPVFAEAWEVTVLQALDAVREELQYQYQL